MPADYDAIVYDLDGTLVRLNVDWEAARRDAATVLQAQGVDTTDMELWDIFEAAGPNDVLGQISETIATHERRGARNATQLPVADELPQSVPVGVCSLNSEDACQIALEVVGLDTHVDEIVGRDSVDSHKPDPEPLLTAIESIGATPARSVFVGDTDRDAEAAEQAGVSFQFVYDRLDE